MKKKKKIVPEDADWMDYLVAFAGISVVVVPIIFVLFLIGWLIIKVFRG